MSGDDLYLDMAQADNFLSLLMGGMSRAQDRFNAKLRTVDEHGNPIEVDAPRIDTTKTTGVDVPPPYGKAEA